MKDPSWWQAHEKISKLQGYKYPDFKWQLRFKAENTYLTDDRGKNFPLGTSCWIIALVVTGGNLTVAGDTVEEVVREALNLATQELKEMIDYAKKKELEGDPISLNQEKMENLKTELQSMLAEMG